ncbi:sigma-70 family RNA polymerase sigma factor [Opitutus terrae]|uniref:RNA polymerase, sigma-24 subunit, ECF subfamily n=1 Tax=Opitutus terrae (strain DSM 11246 / JCM 15787 / PB90-1) TaxID=452637 RepID=B1ZMB9_OPITP|nr:sigma-70 family RNA polymerase sigma factor [Opitutus terrae]ACB73372.1 RNA polymerase, sigma-24 subunit, ECF subfamily [Opitutus terrae PB90-1]
MTDDLELLRHYAEQHSPEAFAELVQRHCGFVYHAALRQLSGDDHAARDVTQRVFNDLARKAAQVSLQSSVVGWLHTATRFAAGQVRRTEARRRERELAAHALEPAAAGAGAHADWEKLRPVIDDAIGTLNERDREAVLMRFFEDRPFAEIGDRFFTSEDAARVRVNRALEKLQSALAQRGITSTATALALALEGQAGLAAPAGLANTVTSGALAGAAGGPFAAWSFMVNVKFVAGLAGVIALLAIGTVVHQRGQLSVLKATAADAQHEVDELRARLQQAQAKIEAEGKRAQAADEDNARLIEAMGRMAALNRQDATATSKTAAVTEEEVDRRHRHARELAANGRHAEALQEYLWCFDDGMTRFPRFYGTRTSYLLAELGELADQYPPAREALRARRDAAAVRMRGNPAEATAVPEWVALNEVLGDGAQSLALFDELPPTDPRRQALGARLVGTFVEQKRYAEAIEVNDYARQRGMLELSISTLPQVPAGEQREAIRRTIVQGSAAGIEALAGAGEAQQARELAWRLLEFDSSETTRRLLQEHATRAGVPELISGLATTSAAPTR